MKNVSKILFVLTLVMFGTMTMNAQNRVELEDAMFKAWDGWEPGANVVLEPEQVDGNDFSCDNSMYQEVGGGATIYGSYKVHYLWYADLTGTHTMYIEGTAGMQLRILINRPAPEEGGEDNHGGKTTEINVTLDEEGKTVVDLSGYEYVHLNAIKTAYGGPKGRITKIEIEGTVESTGEQKTPLSDLSAGYEMDVVCISLGGLTNLNTLLDGRERLIYPNECVSIKVNDSPVTLVSVEGMSGGRILAFIDEGYPEGTEDKVEVSFTNPSDPALHLTFVDGRWMGEDVPSFTDMKAAYQEGLGQYYTSKAEIPTIVSAYPEDGSFNLPLDLAEFKVEFSGIVNCEVLKAALDGEALAVTPATGYSKEVTLTRSGGNLTAGEHVLIISEIEPELNYFETRGEISLLLNFGPVNVDTEDQPKDILPLSYFTDCANGGIPEGFTVFFGEEERVAGNTYTGGARVMAFGDGGDFTRGLYFRDKYVEYGGREGYELPLEEGMKYDIKFNTAAWKSSGMNILFEIIDPDEVTVISEIVTTTCDVNGSTEPVSGSTAYNLKFIPISSGNYKLKWTPCDGSGKPSGWAEALLANVQVRYLPNVAGVAEMNLVNTAIENARNVLNENLDERYSGTNVNLLKTLLDEYEKTTFTSSSLCQTAAEKLDAAAQSVVKHRQLCDTYDLLPIQAQELLVAFDGTKFAATTFYASLQTVADRYADKVLTDDLQLEVAIAELETVVNDAKSMFTEGTSKCGKTGYAALLERIRIGTETALLLGADESEQIIERANNALVDDDNIADGLKLRIKELLYGQLKDEDNTLFQEILDETTMTTTKPTYDMTVFVKNPNLYKVKASTTDLSQENVPGWIIEAGTLTTGWSQVGSDIIPADGMVNTLGASAAASQTVTELPAGIYTIMMGFGERTLEGCTMDDGYMFVKTTEGDSVKVAMPYIGGSTFPVGNLSIENIQVTDGQLAMGIHANATSHIFFNDVKVIMTAPVSGFDYNQAWAEGVEDVVAPVYPVHRSYYDLYGRCIDAEYRGVVIVRDVMSDGSIRTRKLIK